MKKLKAKFLFENNYDDINACVLLEINYDTKEYSIYPIKNESFRFIKTSKNWKMWLAVLKCIEQAINFGNKELNIEQKNNMDSIELDDNQEQEGIWFSGIVGEGEFKKWYCNGNLEEHSNWKNGQLHGEFKKWHWEGNLEIHNFWENGKRNGECKMYNKNGSLIVYKLYENDVLITSYLC